MPLKKRGAYIQATLYGITSDIQGIQGIQESWFMAVNSAATPVKNCLHTIETSWILPAIAQTLHTPAMRIEKNAGKGGVMGMCYA
jgi:hypothetical protein